MTPRIRTAVIVLSLAFAAAHLRALPRTLGDIDTVNFALGVESFDVARHQPHPPGYPVFIAIARASTAGLRALAPSLGRDRLAATGLAVISLAAGTLALWAFTSFWISVGFSPPMALAAAALAVASPLAWFTAGRPLSDTAGLVAATAVVAVVIRAWRDWRPSDPAPAAWRWGAFGAGLLIGLRSQTVWQTAPVLVAVVIMLIARRRARDAAVMTVLAALGVALWLAPMIAVTGGADAFATALRSQGAEDLAGVELLATQPSWDLFSRALARTFAEPWQVRWLGRAVLVLAFAGVIRSVVRRDRAAALVALSFGPYLVFHLLFHEVATMRYALPLVVPVAGFAVWGLGWLGDRVAAVGTALLALASLVVVHPVLERTSKGRPVFLAFQDMFAARATTEGVPDVRTHHQVWWGVDRPMDWYRPIWDFGPQPFPGDREWLGLVERWRNGATTPVWFLADLARHDLEAFDPRSTRLRGRYVLDAEARRLIGGTRLDSLNWWSLERPYWMLGPGWALNPELAGMASADRAEPHRRPAEAWVRRAAAPRRLLIGGRYVADGPAPPARITVTLDDALVDSWIVDADHRWFVRWMDVSGGSPGADADYARLQVRVDSADPARPAPDGPFIVLEQFDVAPAGTMMFAYLEDWYEREADPRTGTNWRWTSAASTLQVLDAPGDLTLTISGQSPLRDFDAPPNVRVVAGTRELGRFSPSADFTETIRVPADALKASEGRLSIQTDRTFSPAERGESADPRRLGLRLYRVTLAAR